MAYDNNQKDFSLPAGKDDGKRESSEFLPKYFRTPVNNKFLHSTVDQLISQGTLEKINACCYYCCCCKIPPSNNFKLHVFF